MTFRSSFVLVLGHSDLGFVSAYLIKSGVLRISNLPERLKRKSQNLYGFGSSGSGNIGGVERWQKQ